MRQSLAFAFLVSLTLFSCGEKAIDETKDICSPMVTSAVNDINDRCWYLESARDERTIKTQVSYLVEACIALDRSGVTRCRMSTSEKGRVEIHTQSAHSLCQNARVADRDSQLAVEYATQGTFVSPWADLSYHPTRASTN